ncbi:sensor histidine kinase [Geovibrio ferrireducens]|jgi:signal transduction histidine kinase|uniref:sensor histidine kinase n=1 Tax=Geovibrio ferrireducens TaxID=46201 RepID=UPI002245B0F0|nr:HAMP domain-containing sensor histidine kinase [Geovibrio ferrireducens]
MKIPLKKLLVHSFIFLFFFLVCLVIADHYLSVRLAVAKTEDTYKGLAGLLEETVKSAADTFSIRLNAVSDVTRHHVRDVLHSFPADGREASILADGYSASTKRPYAIMIFGMDGRMLYSGKSAGASDDWALTPAAKDFDTARENPGGVTRIRYSYSKKASEIMSFEWSPEQGKYAAVMTEYSFGDEIASRMKNIHGESSLFTDIGVYSLGTSAVDSAAVYGAELSPDDFAVFADVHEEQTFFMEDSVYKTFRCDAEQLFPWEKIGIKAVLNPEGINRMKQGSMMLAAMTLLFSGLFMYYVFGIFRRRFEIPYSEVMRLFGESKKISLRENSGYVAELKELILEYNRHLEETDGVLLRLESCKEDLKRRSEEEAERLETQKEFMIQQMKLYSIGEMVASVSHHWREPLSLVHINMQNIKEEISSGIEDEKYLAECINTCRNQIKLMMESVDRFLSFVATDKSGEDSFEVMPLLDEVHSFVSTYYEKDGVGFVFYSDTSKRQVTGSASVLKQVLLNILMVSRELVETNGVGVGTITLGMGEENGGCVIAIEDSTGKFREACVSALEDPLSTPNLKKGMGLYISSKLIEKNFNGRVEAVPSAKGTRFRIIIP